MTSTLHAEPLYPALPEAQPTRTGGGTRTVFRMLLSERATSTLLPLFLPLGVAVLMLGLAWVHAVLTGHPLADYSGFINHNSMQVIILPLVLGVTMLLSYRSHARLILGMGLGRWDYFRGYLSLALYRAALATLVYAVTLALELLNKGYGRGWQVFNQDFDTWSFAFDKTYSTLGRAYAVTDYLATWFIVLLAVQVAALFIAIVSLRWGSLAMCLMLCVVVLLIFNISRQLFGATAWDMGIGTLWGQFHSDYDTYNVWELAAAQGGVADRDISVFDHPPLELIVWKYGLLVFPLCAAYLLSAMSWARASLR